MTLREKITEDMKAAMKARESEKLGAIRLLQAALKQKEVDERIELTDDLVLAIIEKMLKQRKDSIEQYTAGNRLDLVAREEFEVNVLSAYMPAQLSDADVDAILTGVIAETGATSAKDMGKVMNALRPKVAGRADMGRLSGLVKARLG
ncbi:MAG: GatB/YqeY domain-containing protein [Betaproteobacteria bacterium]|nr:GatB/YqeY domain-containing protein [Betaproteobacteria bacterium]